MTRRGLAANDAIGHCTRSAILPGAIEPIAWPTPLVIAGLIVTLARKRRTRSLSLAPESSGSAPRSSLQWWAIWKARVTDSPTRPIAWESDEIMLMIPRSWSTVSAAIVSARTRLSANDTSSGMSWLRWWQTITMSSSSSTELMP